MACGVLSGRGIPKGTSESMCARGGNRQFKNGRIHRVIHIILRSDLRKP